MTRGDNKTCQKMILKSPFPRLRYRIGPSSTIIGLKPLIPEAIALKLISKYYS